MAGVAPLLGRLKLRQLVLVAAVAETRNLHRAAEQLGLSQPSATKLLQEIEHALGVRLFERGPQGMLPTPSGILAARHARLLMSDLERMRQDLHALKTGLSGPVRIGTVVAAVPNLLAPVLTEVVRDHPAITASLTVDTSDALLVALQDGRLDLMIGRTLGATGADGFDVVPLADEALCVVTGPDNPLARLDRLELGELVGHPWILQPSPSPMRRAVDAVFTLARLPVPPHPVEASSVLATVALLEHGPLLAMLPRAVARAFTRQGLLRELPVPIPDLLGPFALITVSGRPLSPAAARLRDLLCLRSDRET